MTQFNNQFPNNYLIARAHKTEIPKSKLSISIQRIGISIHILFHSSHHHCHHHQRDVFSSQPRPQPSVTGKRPGRGSGDVLPSWTRGTTNTRRTCGSSARACTPRRRRTRTNIPRTRWTAAAASTTPCRGSSRLGRPICLCVSFH